MPNAVQSNASQNSASVKDIIDRNNKVKGPKVVKRGANGNLGKDAFLKLLVTKLSKQDPLKPVSDENFIAQMAQFSALEQMNNVSKNMKNVAHKMLSLEANDALGKHVTGLDYLTGNLIKGKVTRVRKINDSTIILTVNKRTMNMNDVQSIYVPETSNVSRETMQYKPSSVDTRGTSPVKNSNVDAARAYQQNQAGNKEIIKVNNENIKKQKVNQSNKVQGFSTKKPAQTKGAQL